MMSNKLTYKKVFVDSQYRLPQSKSSSDFVVELNENLNVLLELNAGLPKYQCRPLGRRRKMAFMNTCM